MSRTISPSSGQPDTVGIHSPHGQLPASTRIGKVRLAVSNLEKSVRFYRDVIGLAVFKVATEAETNDGPLASLGEHGSDRVLLELQQLPGVKPIGQGSRRGLYHTAFLLPSRAALGSFVRHLAKLGTAFGSADHLFSEAIYLVDPDGLTVEVYADRDRSAWLYDDRQIVGATKPLQFAELSRIAGGPWQGAPEGTTVGHIHLYVGDLDRAKRFYHTAMGLDIVTWNLPGALFLSAGGYHHHIGFNTWAAGSPIASEKDARLLFWELVLPDHDAVAKISSRLRTVALSSDESAGNLPAFADSDGIRVIAKVEGSTQG